MRHFKAGEGKHAVELDFHETGGHGVCAFIYGGERAHVGGVSLAVPHVRLDGSALTADVSQICAPLHKDVELASRAAYQFAVVLNQTASVTVGIHIDDATEEDIQQMRENADAVIYACIHAIA